MTVSSYHTAYPPLAVPDEPGLESAMRAFVAPTAVGHWAGRAVVTYFSVVPLLWLTGLVLPVAFLLMAAAAIVTFRMPFALRHAWPWYAVGAAQAVSVVTNWAIEDRSLPALLKHFLSSYVSGWLLIGAAISVGASGLVSLPSITRAWSRLSWSWLLLAIPTAVAAFAAGDGSLSFISPVGMFVPDTLPSKTFAFSIYLFSWDEMFGFEWPRIVLFFPWANILGMAGIALALAGLADADRRRRWTFAAIGTVMVMASLGRLPIVLLVIAAALRFWLALHPPVKLLSLLIAAGTATTIAAASGSPPRLVDQFTDTFQEARAGSSDVRSEIYEANWKGFYDAPFVGHGWPGEAVFERDEDSEAAAAAGMVVGSHSTISGLLYKGGILSFALLVVAFVITAARLARAISWSAHASSAFCVVVALAFMGGGESLESFAMPLLFVFVWMGAVLRTVTLQPAGAADAC